MKDWMYSSPEDHIQIQASNDNVSLAWSDKIETLVNKISYSWLSFSCNMA